MHHWSAGPVMKWRKTVMFSKQHTNIVKTVAIIMLYIHHLFYSTESYEGYVVSFAPLSESQTLALAQCCKVCVAVFVFLSAYGITVSFMRKEKESRGSLKELYTDNFCRYLKLLSGFVIIYILGQMFSFLGRSNAEVYGSGVQRVAYTILDILGIAQIFGTPLFNSTWWYMGLAITILLLMPLLYKGYRHIGPALLALSVVVPRMLALEFTVLHWYLPTVCLGICFAAEGVFEKMRRVKSGNAGRFCKLGLSVCGLFILSCFRYKTGLFLDITDGVMAVLISYICFELFAESGIVLKNIIGFIGKYSMNMFLAHTFFKAYYFHDFTYSFHNAWLILFMLIAVTLLFSVCVEWGKKVSRYNRAVEKLVKHIRREKIL